MLLPQLGIRAEGYSPFTASYVRFGKQISAGYSADRSRDVRSRRSGSGGRGGGETLPPLSSRISSGSWHHFAAIVRRRLIALSPYAAAVQFRNVGYIPFMVFDGYANHGNLACRWLVEKLLDRLMPEPLIRVKAPAMTEASVMWQGRRIIVHLLYYSPQRRTPKLDIVEELCRC